MVVSARLAFIVANLALIRGRFCHTRPKSKLILVEIHRVHCIEYMANTVTGRRKCHAFERIPAFGQ